MAVDDRAGEPRDGMTAQRGQLASQPDLAAALRHEQLAIRTIAVTFRAALRRALSDGSMPREVREDRVRTWRAWALDALARYGSTARSLPIPIDGDLGPRLVAIEEELEAAVASVKGDPTA